MALKILKGVWFFSVLGLLGMFFYVYAGLPELVTLWETPEPITLSRNGLFYLLILTIGLLNATVYLVRQLLQNNAGFVAWFFGMMATINLFIIAVLGFIHVFNGGDRYDYTRMAPAIYGSLILISVWLISWPVIKLSQKFSSK
ncbi:MAG: hypothetical protein KF856_17005 [Cyclobacteriaceae bacterium]|nr:hypothetical protein [Cyclobacteriaceae bacterium]